MFYFSKFFLPKLLPTFTLVFHTSLLLPIIPELQTYAFTLPSNAAYKDGLKCIHTNAVNQHKPNLRVNRVLNRGPPDVSSDEDKLPRKTT